MKRATLVVLGALALGACTTTQLSTTAQVQEKAMIAADDLYVAVATAINGYVALPSTTAAQAATANGIEVKAYNDLLVIRQAYAAGKAVDLSLLTADATAATSATGQAISAN